MAWGYPTLQGECIYHSHQLCIGFLNGSYPLPIQYHALLSLPLGLAPAQTQLLLHLEDILSCGVSYVSQTLNHVLIQVTSAVGTRRETMQRTHRCRAENTSLLHAGVYLGGAGLRGIRPLVSFSSPLRLTATWYWVRPSDPPPLPHPKFSWVNI